MLHRHVYNAVQRQNSKVENMQNMHAIFPIIDLLVWYQTNYELSAFKISCVIII